MPLPNRAQYIQAISLGATAALSTKTVSVDDSGTLLTVPDTGSETVEAQGTVTSLTRELITSPVSC